MVNKTSYYSNSLFFIIDSTLQNPGSYLGTGVVSGDGPPPAKFKIRFFDGVTDVQIPYSGYIPIGSITVGEGVVSGEGIAVSPPEIGAPGVPTGPLAPQMTGDLPVGGIPTTPAGGSVY